MWFSNYRQKLQLLIIIFFTFIAFGAADDAWMPWVRTRASSIAPARSFACCVLCVCAHASPSRPLATTGHAHRVPVHDPAHGPALPRPVAVSVQPRLQGALQCVAMMINEIVALTIVRYLCVCEQTELGAINGSKVLATAVVLIRSQEAQPPLYIAPVQRPRYQPA